MSRWLDGTVPTLAEALAEWEDADCAGFLLGVCLGLWPNTGEAWLLKKGLFWSRNAFGEMLLARLEDLAHDGLLEVDVEEQRYRWKGAG